MKSQVAALLLVTTLAMPALSAEEPAGYPIERLRAPLDRDSVLEVESGRVPEHLRYDVGLWLNYGYMPLGLYKRGAGGGVVNDGALVGHRVGASLTAAVGLFDWVQLGVELPVTVFQSRIGVPADGPFGALAPAGIGDIRLAPKVRLLRAEEHFLDLAVVPSVTLPTSFPKNEYMGEKFFTFAPELAASRTFEWFRLAANVGLTTRSPTRFSNVIIGQEAQVRVGGGARLHPLGVPLTIDGSVGAHVPLVPLPDGANQVPAEMLLGVSFDGPFGLQPFGGLGAGIAPGARVPQARMLAGLRYAPRVADTDHDGVENDADPCPDQPEDKDGFEDSDGCPEADNDNDGVLDADDQCPVEAGVAARSGCPVPDTDGDSLADDVDTCPEVAGVVKVGGCPDADNDGVADGQDACPAEAGTDANGCPPPPPPDADADGVRDDEDQCPSDAGAAEHQGCPDTDGDGLFDHEDRCPAQGGVVEEGGCPAADLKVTRETVELDERVFFELGIAKLRPRSKKTLDRLADTLKTHAEITKVRIEGHTDDVGDESLNQKLSQRRAEAVLEHLVTRGVARDRLEAVGYGSSRPLVEGKSPEVREKNRRVEVTILERK